MNEYKKSNKKLIIKNTSYALLANIISLICSFVVTLIVPKVISIEDNGYFNLYIFYLQYIGVFCLGWIDGIVLRYAGKDYSELDRPLFHSEFIVFSFIEAVLSFAVIFFVSLFVKDVFTKEVLILFSFAIIISMPCSFMRYIFQATNRIVDYSKNYLLERVCYVTLILLCILLGIYKFEIFIICDLIGKLVSLFYIMYQSKDIIFYKGLMIGEAVRSGCNNIVVGIKLLIANLAGFFIIGSVRYVIKMKWGIATFAKLSLSLSISNLCMTFIRALSLVIFPILKKIDQEKMVRLYLVLRNIVSILLLGMLLFYYPIQLLLNAWLPQYSDSVIYLALLFPVCVYECKTALLLETYIKALRKESYLMIINICTVISGMILSVFFFFLIDNIIFTVLVIDILVAVKSILLEKVVSKAIEINVTREIVLETVLAILFVYFNWAIAGAIGFVLYMLCYLFYLWMNKNNIKKVYKLIEKR